jgi:hypothetical protein
MTSAGRYVIFAGMAPIPKDLEQRYLTKRQTELYTGLSIRFWDSARAQGLVSFIKLGKVVLFERQEIDRFLKARRVSVALDSAAN